MGVKLLDQVREAIRVRHYSRRTEEAYAHWIRRYIVFHGKVHPATLGANALKKFLEWLAVEQRVSASTQNQALSALLFLYREVLGVPIGEIGPGQRSRGLLAIPGNARRTALSKVSRGQPSRAASSTNSVS